MCFNVYDTFMGINGEEKLSVRLHLTLTPLQDAYLSSKVESGKCLSKQDAVRALIEREMEAVPA